MLHLDWRFLPVFDPIDPATAYNGTYHAELVALSVVVATLAAFVALSISQRILAAKSRRARWTWASAGASAMGGGIWGMHFIGMLAFTLPCGVDYAFVGTVMSMIPGILASGVALHVISRRQDPGFFRLMEGAVLMGVGISLMHYSGMAAMAPAALLRYDPGLVAVSFIVAVALAFLSLSIRFGFHRFHLPSVMATALAAPVMGFAVAGMHYTAMQASIFFPLADARLAQMSTSPMFLAVLIGVFIGLVMVTTLVAAFAGRQVELAQSLADEVAERRRTEEALRAAQVQLEDAIESISEGFVLFDRDDRYVLTNSKYRELFPDMVDAFAPGTSYQRMLRTGLERKLWTIRGDPEEWIRKTTAWHRAASQPQERQLGDGRWMRLAERRTRDGGIVGIRTDITEIKRAEGALLRKVDDLEAAQRRLERLSRDLAAMAADRAAARDAAEQANHAKSEFLASVSHELRTPLNAILGYSEMLELGLIGKLEPQQIEKLQIIHQSGKHLHNIINDILDLAKIDAGKLELYDEESVNLREVVDSCIALIRERAAEGGLYLAAEIDPAMPLIIADVTRLKQILLNLLANAIKFTQPGGSVTVAGHARAGDGAVFEVRDTGPGMTPEEIKIALEPFGQVDAQLARHYEGTGLGLPLARRFTELHGGVLQVESEKGCGTTVRVILPPARVMADPASIGMIDAA